MRNVSTRCTIRITNVILFLYAIIKVIKIFLGSNMDQKIITKLDSNQITFNTESVSEDSILKNELLIKELVMQLRDRELYSTFSEGKKVDELKQLEVKLEELFSVTGVNNIYDLQELIKRLASSNLQKAEVIDKLNNANKQLLTKVENQGVEQDNIINQFSTTKSKMKTEFKQQLEDVNLVVNEQATIIEKLQSEKDQLIEHNNNFSNQVNSLQANALENESIIETLTNQKLDLDNQIVDFKNLIEQLEQQLEQINQELDDCKNQYNQLKSRKLNRVMDKVSRSGK